MNAVWTTTHALLVVMGGFHFYIDGEPLHPLSPEHVLELVERGELVPPTLSELNDKSKCDALSKGLAILQTLWFVAQCIGRLANDLPITSLEAMTWAYAAITVAMYIAWWPKPLNVGCPFRVLETEVKLVSKDRHSIWRRIFCYVLGGQDDTVDLCQLEGVPIFWSGDREQDVMIANFIALLVTMVFGALHCAAWSYAFPSRVEQQMWRGSAITVTTVPVAMAFSLGVAALIGILSDALSNIIGIATFIFCALVYITARLILLVLSFTALRSLPFGAYQTVLWTTFLPHI